MIITLLSTPKELGSSSASELGELFSELLRASLRSHHFVILDRTNCDWAMQNLGLSDREFSQLKHLRQHYTQYGGFLNDARCYLEVLIGSQKLTEKKKNVYTIGHADLLESNLLSPPKLLVENSLNDGKFFDIIFTRTARRERLSPLRFDIVNGGGSTIHQCFKQELENRNVVVCIADSDKYSPYDSVSSTVKKLTEEGKKSDFVGTVAETLCRETENHISLEILKTHNLCPDFSSYEFVKKRIESQNISNKSDCLWLFLDIVNGLEADKLDKLTYGPSKSWLRQKWLDPDVEFKDIEFKGFGSSLLQQFLDSGAAIQDFIKYMESDYWKFHFKEFFIEKVWYFLAERQSATR